MSDQISESELRADQQEEKMETSSQAEASVPEDQQMEESTEETQKTEEESHIEETPKEEKNEDMNEEHNDEEEKQEDEKVESTPKRRGRPPKGTKKVIQKEKAIEPLVMDKRKRAAKETVDTPKSSAKRGKHVFSLSYEDFVSTNPGARILSCGEGDQLGHPGRSTTKKPRKIDIIEEDELKIVQVVAGGVHSAILTTDGIVYSCGINEKGTVPAEGVESEGSTDEYKKIIFSEEINRQGKIVMLSAGASFTAALTDKGSVIAWGNLRDGSGKMDIHHQLVAMQQHPIIILRHKPGFSIVKIAAGENHLVMLSEDGNVYTFGDFSMGQLGRSSRLDRIRTQYIAAESETSLHVTIMDKKRKKVRCKNVFAGGFWSAFLAEDDKLFVCGLNNFGHLGVAINEPEKKGGVNSNNENGDDTELRILLPQLSTELSGHNWTHIEGVQHLVLRDDKGDVYCIGKNTDNALGLGTWSNSESDKNWRYNTLQKLELEDSAGISAQLGCSIVWTTAGNAIAWGYDSSGQLGLGLKDDDDKVVAKPEPISSAHLDGFKIVQVSVADNHAIFLVVKK